MGAARKGRKTARIHEPVLNQALRPLIQTAVFGQERVIPIPALHRLLQLTIEYGSEEMFLPFHSVIDPQLDIANKFIM